MLMREMSREAPRGGEGPNVDHRSGGRPGGRERRETWDRPCDIRVESMAPVSFSSLTVPADQSSALFGSWVSFDARGICPRPYFFLQALRRNLV